MQLAQICMPDSSVKFDSAWEPQDQSMVEQIRIIDQLLHSTQDYINQVKMSEKQLQINIKILIDHRDSINLLQNQANPQRSANF